MTGRFSLSLHLQFKLKTHRQETEKSWIFKMDSNYQIRFWNWTKTYQFQTKCKMIFKTWRSTATRISKNPWLSHRNPLFKTDWTTTSRNLSQINCLASGTSSVKTRLAVSKDSRAQFVKGKEWKEAARIAQKILAAKILASFLWNHLPLTLSNSLKIRRTKQMSTIWAQTLLLCQCNWNRKLKILGVINRRNSNL